MLSDLRSLSNIYLCPRLGTFQKGSNRVSRLVRGYIFEVSMASVSRVFQKCFKRCLRYLKEVSCCMAFITDTRAEGKLVSEKVGQHYTMNEILKCFKTTWDIVSNSFLCGASPKQQGQIKADQYIFFV